jgi:hypothetical protein
MTLRNGTSFELRFDFVDQELQCNTSDGRRRSVPLAPQSVAQFKTATMRMLADLDISVAISDLPCEIAGATPFSRDQTPRVYDGDAARRFHRVLSEVDRVLKQFRTCFLGKASPVHFFWGSFDLAVTRFSGESAPLWEGTAPGVATIVMQEAYSHEVSSAGFWPGGAGVDASFYSYAYPEPPGFKEASVAPAGATYSETFRQFLLPTRPCVPRPILTRRSSHSSKARRSRGQRRALGSRRARVRGRRRHLQTRALNVARSPGRDQLSDRKAVSGRLRSRYRDLTTQLKLARTPLSPRFARCVESFDWSVEQRSPP